MKETKVKGFVPLNGNQSYRPHTLNILLFAGEGGGKSRFIATAPSPGGIILDPKSEISIRREAESRGTSVLLPDPKVTDSLINDISMTELRTMDNEKFMEHYQKRVDTMTDLLMELVAAESVRTIFVDPFYQFCAEVKMALQGKRQKMKKTDSGKVFQDNDSVYQYIIKVLNRLNQKHTILTFKHKDEYINDNKSGRMTWDWGAFKHIGNHTNCAIELVRNPKLKASWRYAANFRNCLHNPTLEGEEGQAEETQLKDEVISFEMVARAVFPDVEEDVFEKQFM